MNRLGCVLAALLCAISPLFASAADSIWVNGAERELNANYGFFAEFQVDRDKIDGTTLRISAGTIARIWVNGAFAGYGPARAPEGHMRVDEWPLAKFIHPGRNVIAIEVSNAAINQFYYPEMSGYLWAEVSSGGSVLASTGRDFKARALSERVKRVNRFSYQREFAEFWRVKPGSNDWRVHGFAGKGLPLTKTTSLKPLDRGVPLPKFEFDRTFRPTLKSVLRRDPARKFRPIGCIENAGNGSFKGFKKSELEVNLLEAVRPFVVEHSSAIETLPITLSDGESVTLKSDFESAGFPILKVNCRKSTKIYLVFDEFPGLDGQPNPIRFSSCVGVCGWELLEPGEYALECIQPYALGCAQLIVDGGEVTLTDFTLRRYDNPVINRAKFKSSNPAHAKIFDAARRSLSLNAVDCFTDCPGRERGIYFGDTTFTARGADVLLGDNAMERVQFMNYALADRFHDVPDGMIPMCYPSDVTLGEAHWISNFGLWSVIQLEGYLDRSGDRATVDAYRPRAEALLDWFRRSRNADGVLEKLPGWVFVEWSDAQNFVQDVSYVSNMIYLRYLNSMAKLYARHDCAEEAVRLRETLLRQSWRDKWFVDNAKRTSDGSLEPTANSSELCQYMAFFSGVATRETHPDLWRRLVESFGPTRKQGVFPKIHRSNLLFGYSLRFWLLDAAGESQTLLNELEYCYLPMAEKNGALWESMTVDTLYSACHGFPSMAADLLVKNALGLRHIDRVHRRIKFVAPTKVKLDWCEGTIPVSPSEEIEIRWSRRDGKIKPEFKLPTGWSLAN